MTPREIHRHFLTHYEGLVATRTWGETAYFYNPDEQLKNGTYFATIKTRDGENDRASVLDRADVWRLSMGLPNKEYEDLFGAKPARPGKGETVTFAKEGVHDFMAIDEIMPHPVYAWMGWVAVNNPSPMRFDECIPLLNAAYKRAKQKFDQRIRAEAKKAEKAEQS